ncbi:50S ribosomal protein L10 [Chloroflexota bacterium]
MSREKKTQIIERLREAFSTSSITILTDYRGLTTPEMTGLRRKLQESGSEYTVVKNTMARFAAERAGKDEMVSSFIGPIAIAFSYGDITAPARVLVDYSRNSAVNLSIKGGFLYDRLLTSEEVITLSSLPPREILLARALCQMKSPISALLGCLATPMKGIIGVLQARIKQLEGE